MEFLIERLLHEENKVKGMEETVTNSEEVIAAGHRYRERGPKSYNCGEI